MALFWGITTLGIIAKNVNDSEKMDEQAVKKNIKSFTKVSEAELNQSKEAETMVKATVKLSNRKKAVLSTTMDSFVSLYGRIKKINFIESDGIKELDLNLPKMVEEINTQITVVGNINNPPTITRNVVIGWLTGGIVGALAGSLTDDAKRNLDTARLQARKAEAAVAQIETVTLAYKAITERVNRMADALTKLNYLFMKSIQHTNEIIDKNGQDKTMYSKEERRDLGICVNLAGTIKNMIDAPIIDEKGELTELSIRAVLNGENCLKQLNSIL